MDNTLILLDGGFLSKLSKHFGKGQYLKYDLISFSKNLAKKQGLFCSIIFYYTAPPFQSDKPTKEEAERYQKNNVPPHLKRCGLQGHLFLGCSEIKSSKLRPHSKECGFNFGHKKYEGFIQKISKDKILIVRGGRCQRLKAGSGFIYKQKAVDPLAIIDLMSAVIEYPSIKRIILVASDSDFVPAIERLKKVNIRIILYTYYEEKNRNSIFSTSNELIKSVYK